MKKITVFLILGALLATMTACGSRSGAEDPTAGQTESTKDPAEGSTAATSESASGTSQAQDPSGEEDGWSPEMTQVREAVVEELGEDYWPNSPITSDYLESSYGITSDLYEDYMGEMPAISVNVDTLLIIKAKSDKVEEVEDLLYDYYDRQVNAAVQYPMNLEKVQAARVQRIGNYVCYVQLGGPAVDEGDTEDKIQKCQAQNDHVIEILSQQLPQE